MFRTRIFGLILIALIIFGLLSLAGYAGWSQGYTMGRLAAGSEGAAAVPYGVYGFGFFPFFFGFGLFFKLGLFLLLFLFVTRLFRFWTWRAAGGPGSDYWKHQQYHRPPWPKESEEQSDTDINEVGVKS